MIQVCSQCGTRWNVRDRRRVWCPRCNGTLLAPTGPEPGTEWSAAAVAAPARPARGATPPRLPPGYRWIAVRPGAPPPPRRGRRPLGPTPRYTVIPRWGLTEHFDHVDQEQSAPASGPPPATVRNLLVATMIVLGAAALIHLVRYALLILNRSMLLNPWIAGSATWLGVGISVIALFMVFASFVVLANWLVARRAAAFAHRGHVDPRPGWALRAGCLVPVVNLVWAPVFVLELAGVEERLTWLRRPVVTWWLVWVASYVVSIWSIVTSFTQDAQGIADNTVTTIVAYLLALAAFLLAYKVFEGFERQPVERPTKRWVMVLEPETPETVGAVEPSEQNPATVSV